jgi:predicted Zn-dependent peptidase
MEDVRTRPVSQDELDRARTKLRSSFYGIAESGTRFGLVDLLAVGAMWENDADWVNRLEAGFAKVTPELLQRTANEYLRPTNRSILLVQPKAAQAAASSTKAGAAQ